MKSSHNRLQRQIAVCLALLIGMNAGLAVAQNPQQPVQQQQSTSSDTVLSENALPENPAPASPQAQANPQVPAQNEQPDSTQNQPQKPVGTAAAPYERTMGVAASRPAGAAIAPAKQKRVRTILISVGVIVAAGVAVGTVVGLSKASPSRP